MQHDGVRGRHCSPGVTRDKIAESTGWPVRSGQTANAVPTRTSFKFRICTSGHDARRRPAAPVRILKCTICNGRNTPPLLFRLSVHDRRAPSERHPIAPLHCPTSTARYAGGRREAITTSRGSRSGTAGSAIIVRDASREDGRRSRALMEIWQANARSIPPFARCHPATLDPNFSGAGRTITDDGTLPVTMSAGAYRA